MTAPSSSDDPARPPVRVSPLRCYALAWRSFAKWWIPICVVSALVFAIEIAPRVLVLPEVRDWGESAVQLLDAMIEGEIPRVRQAAQAVNERSRLMAGSFLKLTLYFFPLVALLTVLLLMIANWAVKDDRRERRSPLALLYVSLVHIVVALVKAIAFLLLIVPGVYIYVRLAFVSLVMLDDEIGAARAVALSWRMTRGNFWPLFLLMLMNAGVQIVAGMSVIGLIPATGFVNTARAAAFRTLKDASVESDGSSNWVIRNREQGMGNGGASRAH